MQTQIDYLNISNLAQISLGTVGASATFSGYFINDDGSTTATSFPVLQTQQSLTDILNASISSDCLVLIGAPAFYLGMNGQANQYLGSNTNYLHVVAGSYRIGGFRNSQFDRVFRNLVPQPIGSTPQTLMAGYDGTVIRPITVDSSGNIQTKIVAEIATAGLAQDSSVQQVHVDLSSDISTYCFSGLAAGNALLNNTPIVVKSASGYLSGFDLFNTGAVTTWLQIFDLASGSVVLGTTAPKLSYPLFAGAAWSASWGTDTKMKFNNQIVFVATTTQFGSTAPAVSISGNVYFK